MTNWFTKSMMGYIGCGTKEVGCIRIAKRNWRRSRVYGLELESMDGQSGLKLGRKE